MKITEFQGACHKDERGKLVFFNEFSMESIKRFYEINPSSTTIIRAWQGHLEETKWFYCTEGSFLLNLVSLDDKGNFKPELAVERFVLDSSIPIILKVPGGYASGFKALKEHSKLIVFSDASLAESIIDDFRFSEKDFDADWGE